MSYDRADWHYGGDFPDDLEPVHGATHIGMFLGWAIKRGFVGELHTEEDADAVAAVRDGSLSGRDFLMERCDERLTAEDLDDEGNRFAAAYYDARYFEDCEACVGDGLSSLYHVEDSPANRAKVEAMLDQRFAVWRATSTQAAKLRAARQSRGERRPWWRRFW